MKKLKITTPNVSPKFNYSELENLKELWLVTKGKADKTMMALKTKFANISLDKLRIDKRAQNAKEKESLYSTLQSAQALDIETIILDYSQLVL